MQKQVLASHVLLCTQPNQDVFDVAVVDAKSAQMVTF
jgi:hypothetical protein